MTITDFSYQLYSSRHHPPLSATLAMLAAAGYAQVEGRPEQFIDDPGGLNELLARHALAMPTAHCGNDILGGDAAELVRACQAVGVKHCYCAYLEPDARPTDAQGWSEFGARLAAAGRPLAAAGIGFGWHNHDFEFAALADGSLPIERILDAAPELEWQIDVAWVIRGNSDPHRWIAKYADRITSVHVKDIAKEGEKLDEDGWADPGEGTVDWPAMFAALAKHTKAAYYVMEHDLPSDDRRFAQRAIANCRQMLSGA